MSRFKKMNQNIKTMWLKALRSGKYKQTQGAMYDNYTGGFCCLGVLQTLIDPENQMGAKNKYDTYIGMPTVACLAAAGLPRYRPSMSTSNSLNTLIKMNDEDFDSFKEIADFIEENL